jgi:hypothetical protein
MAMLESHRTTWQEDGAGPVPTAPLSRRPFRFFTPLLGVILCGYMFFGRPFSYLSIPGIPIYLGEVVLAVGLVEAMRVRSLLRPLLATSLPLKVLLGFMALYGLALAMSVPIYGVVAFRDAAVGYYGIYAFLVALAAVADPGFTPRLVRWFRSAIPWFLVWAPIAVVLGRAAPFGIVPGSATPLNAFTPGDYAIFGAMIVAFVWLGLHRVGRRPPSRPLASAYISMGFVAVLAGGSQNRGGLLAALLLFAIVLGCMSAGRRARAVVSAVVSLALLLGIALVLDLRIPLASAGRELSVQQVMANLTSVVQSEDLSRADTGNLQGNVDWRRQYWSAVYKDALSPRYVLTGRGLGTVLSFEYGIEDPSTNDGQPIRGAHNTHLTVLARTGVPGISLWILLCVIWSLHVARRARTHDGGGASATPSLAAWLLGAVAAYLVTAFFDPFLDSPRGAIWFYTLVGLGAAHAGTEWRRRPRTDHGTPDPREAPG